MGAFLYWPRLFGQDDWILAWASRSINTQWQYMLNWPLPMGAFQGQWNTTKRQNRTTTTVKNPNWPEASQLAIYKCSWEVEPGTTRIKFTKWSEQVLNPGSPDLKASALTTANMKHVTRVHSFQILSANWLVECFSAKYHIWKPLALVVPNMVISKLNNYSDEACFPAHKGPLHVSTLMGFW